MEIIWKDEYRIGVDIIDEQHKEFIEILGELLVACEGPRVEENLKKLIDQLQDYANKHFAFEERCMREFNYEEAEEHAKEHLLFRQQILSIKEKYNRGDHILQYDIFDLMQSWLKNHVTGEDKKFVSCFREHGLK